MDKNNVMTKAFNKTLQKVLYIDEKKKQFCSLYKRKTYKTFLGWRIQILGLNKY